MTFNKKIIVQIVVFLNRKTDNLCKWPLQVKLLYLASIRKKQK